MTLLTRVQRIGAQAVTGAFRTVATAVAEAEANLHSVTSRLLSKTTSFWTNLNTLPPSHPLTKVRTRRCRRFASPLQKIAHENEDIHVEGMEKIKPYTVPPWADRLNPREDVGPDNWPTLLRPPENLIIMTSAAEREGLVSSAGATYDRSAVVPGNEITFHRAVIGPRTHHNPYQAELVAIGFVLQCLPRGLRGRHIILGTSNLGAVQAIARPKQQSGQQHIEAIYRATQALKSNGNTVETVWVPAQTTNVLKSLAKSAARGEMQLGHIPQSDFPSAKTTILKTARAREKATPIPPHVGRFSRTLDQALPGAHTKTLYDNLRRNEAAVLIQLRTGMSRLNGYLHIIKAADSDLCQCGIARETVKHFLFRCPRWDHLRQDLLSQTEVQRGNLSFYLGGKTCQDGNDWVPNMSAVHATIKFALRSKRLEDTRDITYST